MVCLVWVYPFRVCCFCFFVCFKLFLVRSRCGLPQARTRAPVHTHTPAPTRALDSGTVPHIIQCRVLLARFAMRVLLVSMLLLRHPAGNSRETSQRHPQHQPADFPEMDSRLVGVGGVVGLFPCYSQRRAVLAHGRQRSHQQGGQPESHNTKPKEQP